MNQEWLFPQKNTTGRNVPEMNEPVGCKLLAKLQSSLDRRNVWNMETTTVI